MSALFAIPSKGRLKEDCFALLERAGLKVAPPPERAYETHIPALPGLRVILISAGEIAERLARGDFHAGITGEDVLRMRNISETVHLDDAILEYIVRLVEATRHNERIQVGSSMRGALALTRCARVWAASDNRGYVVPDDVKNLAVPVLAHRITLTAEATFAGNTPEQMIGQILEDVPAPTLGANA